LEESPERRPYFNLTKPQLVAICVAKFGGSAYGYSKEGKEDIIQMLATHYVLSKLTARGKEYCKTGHQLELSFSSPQKRG
jgi:hypothetical protein